MACRFAKDVKDTSEKKEEEDENVCTSRGKWSSCSDLNEKWTQPPRPYTEATLLRAMKQPESWWIMTNFVML